MKVAVANRKPAVVEAPPLDPSVKPGLAFGAKRAERVANLVARAITTELAMQEDELMQVCIAVGKAYDRVAQSKFVANGDEVRSARQALDRAASNLRLLLVKRGALGAEKGKGR